MNSNFIKKIIIVIIAFSVLIAIILIALSANNISKDTSNVNYKDSHYNEVMNDDYFQIERESKKLRDATKFFSIEEFIKNHINEEFEAEDMRVLEGEKITSYSVYGKINNRDVYYIARVDINNSTCMIENINSNENLEQIDLKTNIQEIDNNNNNSFKYNYISNEELCRRYYNRFNKLEQENPQEAYSKLDEEYKKIRFPSYYDFQEYINDNQEAIERGILSKYSYDFKEDYTECVLVDTYNNTYTIDAEGIMDYKIRLDNYTIKVDTYDEEYKKMSETNKISANSYIWMQMINTKDYKHAYELLDDTFKQNNFDTIEKFKEYVKNEFFTTNYTSDSFEVDRKEDYYTCKFNIRSNNGSSAETKKINIIMQLKEGTDFVMSFSFE